MLGNISRVETQGTSHNGELHGANGRTTWDHWDGDGFPMADRGHVHGSGVDGSTSGGPSRKASPGVSTEPRLSEAPPWAKFHAGLPAARQAIGPTDHIVRHWLNNWGIHYLLGQAGAGKSTILVNLGLHLALDFPKWHGWELEPGYTIAYASGESPSLTLDYVEAFCKQHKVAEEATTRFMVSPDVVDLRNQDDVRILVRWLRRALTPETKLILIVDTWQRATGGADQKDEPSMAAAIRNAEWLSTELGCPVIAAIHPPKYNLDTISGTGILWNSSMAVWKLERMGDALTMTNVRMKGEGEGAMVNLRRTVGVPISGTDKWNYPRTSVTVETAQSAGMTTLHKRICQMKQDEPKVSGRKIAASLRDDGITIGHTKVAELLRQCPQVSTVRH